MMRHAVQLSRRAVGAVRVRTATTPSFGVTARDFHHQGGGHLQHGSGTVSLYSQPIYGTTILAVRKDGVVAVVGDGQVTQGSQVLKPNATKVRRLGDGVIAGFAGATADALTLFERLELKLDEHPGQLARACVALAKEWRTEKYLRKLEALMLVVDKNVSLTLTGVGDVIEPAEDGIIAIGSGGGFAHAAARALIDVPDLTAMEIAEKAMNVAADMCVYTNHNFTKDSLKAE